MSSEPNEPVLQRKPTQASAEVPPDKAGYLAVSRSLAASIIAIMPLLLLYEVGMWRMQAEQTRSAEAVERIGGDSGALAAVSAGRRSVDKNAMAAVMKGPLFIFGRRAMLAFNLVVTLALLVALGSLVKKRTLQLRVYPAMLAESAMYAAVLVVTVNFVLRWQLAVPANGGDLTGIWDKVVAAAGAGVYEELLFRGVLLGALYFVASSVLRMNELIASIAAMAAASAVFSLAHFITPGEFTDWAAFRFRFAAGLVLSVVFLTRGLGIAVWSHALYNVWVFCGPH